MRFLIVSDLHANLEALDAVLADAQSAAYEAVLCLGDVVGYGPNPNEVTSWARNCVDVIIRGNHDKACSGLETYEGFNRAARFSAQWTQQQLTKEHREWLFDLAQGPVPVEDFELVHGSPDDEDRYLFQSAEVDQTLLRAGNPLTFFGHTHVQGGFTACMAGSAFEIEHLVGAPETVTVTDGRKFLINPGSVGQPRDGDSRAGYCLYDSIAHVAEYRRVAYDIRAVQEKILAAGLPEELAFRLASGT